jgi:hypothetical protein
LILRWKYVFNQASKPDATRLSGGYRLTLFFQTPPCKHHSRPMPFTPGPLLGVAAYAAVPCTFTTRFFHPPSTSLFVPRRPTVRKAISHGRFWLWSGWPAICCWRWSFAGRRHGGVLVAGLTVGAGGLEPGRLPGLASRHSRY